MVHRKSTVKKIKKSFLYYVSFCHSFKWKRTIKYLQKSARKEWRQKIFQTWQNVHFRANLSKILNWYCSFIQFSKKWFRTYVSDTAWKVSKYGVFSGPYLDTFHTVCRKICGIGLNDYYLLNLRDKVSLSRIYFFSLSIVFFNLLSQKTHSWINTRIQVSF